MGQGGKGNAGVAGPIKQNPYSIGYVELLYAKQKKMPYAEVKNPAGKFVEASLNSVTAAAAGAKMMPKTSAFRSPMRRAKTAYPISTYTWLLVPSNSATRPRRRIWSSSSHGC